MEHGDQCDPTPMLDRPGVVSACNVQPLRTRAPSSLQKIRLSSDWANPLNGSRNGLAGGDGCRVAPEFRSCARLKGVTVGRLETALGEA